ncbi:MAG TPA: Stp1/IreP family PP2C-type Ser/Thr phosphatase [Fimbriimonadaceae bacterium]|nr:Stp1/IreP family PP2C-type Ser/Thr phosphatase [Fimbriimonadaceae bacterium]
MDEITAEYATEQLAPSADLHTRVRATVACKTDLGRVRENNEDKFEFYVSEDDALLATRGAIYLVCDGMGGAAAGQIASELTAKTFIDVYLHHPSENPQVAMAAAVSAANRFVLDVSRTVPNRQGMGTTLSGLILIQDKAYIVQVGDSRVYRLREGELEQLTEDHSWVEEALKLGMISATEAETHPYKNVITRAVGTEGDVSPDLFVHDLAVGDIFLICSDGLIRHVDDPTIRQVLGEHDPAAAAWRLVGLALQNGGSDNTTVMIVRIDGLEPSG